MAVPASGINFEEALSLGLPCAATLGISNTESAFAKTQIRPYF